MEMNCISKIAGIGAFLPKQRVTSDELMAEISSSRFGTPENYISNKIGIIERRMADDKTLASDMAIMASEVALKDANVQAHEVDVILYCGIERDWQEPATAHRIQAELGATSAIVLDITNACHGFLNGISIADAFIANNSAQTVLVCTGEKQSRLTYEAIDQLKGLSSKEEFRKRLGGLTVGDAGGAMIIQRGNEYSGFKKMNFMSDGKHTDLCYYKHTDTGTQGQMLMREITVQILRLHKMFIESTYSLLDWKPESIDKLFCHQTGAKPHQGMASLAHQPINKAPITYDNYGNLTSASIPVNMFLNRPQRGEKILIMGTGSGLSVCQSGLIF